MVRICITADRFGFYCPEALEALKEVGEVIKLRPAANLRDVLKSLRYCDALIMGPELELDERALEELKYLKIIALHSPNFINVDLEAATRRGTVVLRAVQAVATSVAEYVMALLLSLVKRINEAYSSVKSGRSDKRTSLVGFELRGKKLGILHLGEVGKELANIANRGFGMEILVFDPFSEIPRDYRKVNNFKELLVNSDVITIQDPLPPKFKRLINELDFRSVKEGGILIDVTGGEVISEEVIAELVEEGKLIGVALDSLPKSYRLFKYPNVIITPQTSYYTLEGIARMELMLAEDIVKYFKGERPKRVANPEVFK